VEREGGEQTGLTRAPGWWKGGSGLLSFLRTPLPIEHGNLVEKSWVYHLC